MADQRDHDGWTDGEMAPSEAQRVVRLLHELRPVPTGAELDGARSQAIARAARRHETRRALRSRVAMLDLTVVGLMVTITGTGMAVSGISGSGSAGVAQYGGPQQGQVLSGHRAPPTSGVSVTRQLAAASKGDPLPFTGFAAIPLLAVGLVMLGTGVVARRAVAARSGDTRPGDDTHGPPDS